MQLSRRHLVQGAAGVAAASLAGCTRESAARDRNGFIGIAMPTTGSERWLSDADNLVTQLETAGYRTVVEFGEDVIQDQIDQIEGMVSQGVDFLVIAAIDNAALGQALAKAKDRGVIIIAYDRLLMETPDLDYYASFDGYEVGALQALHIMEQLDIDNSNETFNIEMFSGSPDDTNSEFFFVGALDMMERHLSGGKLVVRSGESEQYLTATARWSGEIAKERMDKLLKKHYADTPIHAVLSPYDGMSRGIVESLLEAGYELGEDFPVVTGQDAESDSVRAIIRGEGQSQTVFKDTRNLAGVASGMVVDIMEGREPDITDFGTYNNGFKFVPSSLLRPVSVDATNWEEVLVDSGYYEEDELL